MRKERLEMGTLKEACEERETKAVVFDRSMDSVREIAVALEVLCEEIEGSESPPATKERSRETSLLSILNSGSDEIEGGCSQIVDAVSKIEECLFGVSVLDKYMPPSTPSSSVKMEKTEDTKVLRLYNAYNRFEREVALIHRLEKEIIGSSAAPEEVSPDIPHVDEPCLEWILSQVPLGIKLLCGQAMDSIKTIRGILI